MALALACIAVSFKLGIDARHCQTLYFDSSSSDLGLHLGSQGCKVAGICAVILL